MAAPAAEVSVANTGLVSTLPTVELARACSIPVALSVWPLAWVVVPASLATCPATSVHRPDSWVTGTTGVPPAVGGLDAFGLAVRPEAEAPVCRGDG